MAGDSFPRPGRAVARGCGVWQIIAAGYNWRHARRLRSPQL